MIAPRAPIDGGDQRATQDTPSKHLPEGQLQTLIVLLDEGAQPHAPIMQLLGKSAAPEQHVAVPSLPPLGTHPTGASLEVSDGESEGESLGVVSP